MLIVLFTIIFRLSVPLSSVFHEFCHVTAARIVGGDGHIVNGDLSMISVLTPFTVLAGYWGEFLFSVAGALLFRRSYLGAHFLGFASAVYLTAFNGVDFQVLVERVGRSTEETVQNWGSVAGALLFFSWVFWITKLASLPDKDPRGR